jgi:hypothetical protein
MDSWILRVVSARGHGHGHDLRRQLEKFFGLCEAIRLVMPAH